MKFTNLLLAGLICLFTSYARAQLTPCPPNPSNCICYGDFESFTSSADLQAGTFGTPGLWWLGTSASFSPTLQTGFLGNNTQYVNIPTCGSPSAVNGGFDDTPFVLPLGCNLDPCDDATLSFDARSFINFTSSPTFNVHFRFLTVDPIVACSGVALDVCPAANTNFLDVVVPIMDPSGGWVNFSQNFINNTGNAFTHVLIWGSHTPNMLCVEYQLDNIELAINSSFSPPVNLPTAICETAGCETVITGGPGQYTVTGPGVPAIPFVDFFGNETWLFCPTNAGVGTHTITVCNSAGCCLDYTVVVNPGSAPNISGISYLACEGDAFTLCPQTPAGNTYTYSWNTGATTECININPVLPGLNTYTVTASNGTGCTTTVDVELLGQPQPDISVTPVPPACAPVSFILNATNSNGFPITWTDNLGTPIGANPASATLTNPATSNQYTATVTDPNTGCTNSQTITVSTLPAPNVTSTLNAQACSDDCNAIILGVDIPFFGINFSPFFTPYNGSNAGNPNNGLFSGTGVQTFGNPNFFAFHVFIPCNNPPASYLITYDYTDQNTGCSASATGTITVFEAPTVTLTASPNGICSNGGSAVIDVNTGPFTGPLTYTWSPAPASTTNNGMGSYQATVTAPGTYTVTVSNGPCSTTESITINNIPAPVIQASPDQFICPGECATLFANSNQQGDVVWTDPANNVIATFPYPTSSSTVTVCPSTPLTSFPYTVTVTNPITGCSTSEVVVVNVNQSTNVTTTLNQSACSDDCNAIILGVDIPFFNVTFSPFFTPYNGSNPGNPNNGEFSGAGVQTFGNPNFFAFHVFIPCNNAAGQYPITYTYNAPGQCPGQATGTINVCDPPQPFIISSNSCNVPATLNVLGLVTPVGCNWTGYQWSGPGITGSSTGASVNVNQLGTYSVTVTNAAGCTETVNFDLNGGTPITVLPALQECEGAIVTLQTTAGPFVSYSWTGPGGYTATGPTADITQSGTYCVTATDNQGCTSTSCLTYTFLPFPTVVIDPVAPIDLCTWNGQPIQLTGVTNSTSAACTWSEDFIGTTGNYLTSTGLFTPTGPGTYQIYYTCANGSCVNFDVINIVVNSATPPSITITPVPTIDLCTWNGQPIPMTALSTGGPCFWSEDGVGTVGNYLSATGDFTPNGVGTYDVYYTCGTGICANTEMITITVVDNNQWHQYTEASAGNDVANDAVVDADGNVYVIGTFATQTTLNGGSNPDVTINTIAGFNGTYVAKYDPCGNLLWQTHTTNSKENRGAAIDLDEGNNHVYALGNMDGALQFTNTCGANVPGNFAGFTQLGYVVRIDMTTGCPQYVSPASSLNFTEMNTIAVDETESAIFVGGRTTAQLGTFPHKAIGYKYVPSATTIGGPVWVIKGNGEQTDVINDFAFDETNQRLWMVGDFTDESQLVASGGAITTVLTTNGQQDAWMAAVNDAVATPTFFQHEIGGVPANQSMSGNGIATDPSGIDVFLTGTYTATFNNVFGLGAGATLNNPGGNSAYHMMADFPAGGGNAWLREGDGNAGQAFGVDVDYRNGAAYFTGNYQRAPITFNPIGITEQYYVIGGALPLNHVYVVAYDDLGVYKWHNVTTDPTSNNSLHTAHAIAAGPNDQSYVVGNFRQDIGYLNGIPASGNLVQTGAGTNAFVMRNDQITGDFKNAELEAKPQATIDFEAGISAMVMPNPMQDQGRLVIKDFDPLTNYRAEIFNLLGEHIGSLSIDQEQTIIDLSEAENGVYLVRVTDGEHATTIQIVKAD